MTLHGIVLFHLNLNFSSIEEKQRPEVLERCYQPMLRLLQDVPGLSLTIEAPGHTLELLEGTWTQQLQQAIQDNRAEFVGSGDTQLIGPLVPAEVNHWNQRLGQETYERILGQRPTTALVSEMAWSQGLVDHYLDAGYQRVLMEWNNPRLTHPEWEEEWRYMVCGTDHRDRVIDLLWIDSAAFQQFARAARGDVSEDDYISWLLRHVGKDPRYLFLYASDAEVFDFRPGRYATERKASGEWERIARLLKRVLEEGIQITTPERLTWRNAPTVAGT